MFVGAFNKKEGLILGAFSKYLGNFTTSFVDSNVWYHTTSIILCKPTAQKPRSRQMNINWYQPSALNNVYFCFPVEDILCCELKLASQFALHAD